MRLRRPLVFLGAFSLVCLLGARLSEVTSADQPYIQLVPPLAAPGQQVTVYGTGFCGPPACSRVIVTVGDQVVVPGVQVGDEGKFQASFTVDGPLGLYTVTAFQTMANGSVVSDFTRLIVPAMDFPTPTPGPSPAPTPPATPHDG